MGDRELSLPYTSLLASALSCGASIEAARRMGLQQLRMLVTARNESSPGGASRDDSGVREATQADIKAFIG